VDIATLSSLAWKHTKNAVAEEVYLKTGYDATKPVAFYGLVNERCNVKCQYCNYWRMDRYAKELTIDEWCSALASVKSFVGRFSINFSGGEPFIKPGFIDLLEWCHRNEISSGVTTNGSAMTRRNAARVVAAHPFNVNFSVDAPTAELHDSIRGYPSLFARLSQGIEFLIEERERQGVRFPIIIKPTVNARNFRVLPELVQWAQAIGASGVNMQPMNRWTPETYDFLWIEEKDQPDLQRIVDRLIAMKRAGAPILTPESIIALMPDHFREKSAPPDVMPCRVGMRDFFIRADGNVEVCFYFPAIGNIKEQSARDIWYGEKANEVRRQTVACEKLCLVTCLSQKTLHDKVKMGLTLLKGQGRRRQGGDDWSAPPLEGAGAG
jgi:MoaA/NifB/PqqE/SkfB family radical SAM enzyme